MEQLIELLKQIKELAATAVDALEGASKGGGGGEGAPEGAPPREPDGDEGGTPPPPR